MTKERLIELLSSLKDDAEISFVKHYKESGNIKSEKLFLGTITITSEEDKAVFNFSQE